MFTGIVQALGILIGSTDTDSGKRLTVSLAELATAPIAPGDSVCVSGVCLTVVKVANGNATFDVVGETLRRSTLGKRHIADRLNLELSLQPNSFVGGHFVQGHVDALGTVSHIRNSPEDWRLTVEIPAAARPLVVAKGSIAIDGVSMTVAEVDENTFTLAVIPTTLEQTTLSALSVGDAVNLETDILNRTVIHYLNLMREGNPELLRQPAAAMAHLKERGIA